MKTTLFFFLAFAFVIGCQGQYPENEVVDSSCHGVTTLSQDSATLIIWYQPLSDGVKWDFGGSYQPNPDKYEQSAKLPVYTYGDSGSFKYYCDSFRRQIVETNQEYPCGFYKFEIVKEDITLFWVHFTKCNPNYLGRN